jgi:uncharacterized protein
MELIGREAEQDTFKHCLQSSESKLVAVYGRRRVGKTFLIRKYFESKIRFEISGLYQGDINDQLKHFASTLAKAGYHPASITPPKNWMAAFELLSLFLDSQTDSKKKVIFIDELPWFDTQKSKFLMAFENFWNSYCSKRSDILMVICGSAASWIINKILKNKGGLHNRVSEKIHIQPFTLYETERFLKQKGIIWSKYDIAQLYLTTGGIPFYLDAIRKGESVVQFVDRACFEKNGILYEEYNELYQSLFNESEQHKIVVELLAKEKQGLRRDEIIAKTQLSTGGTLTKVLDELEKSDFIKKVSPYTQNKNGASYKLDDFFTIFYLKFMSNKKSNKDSWDKEVMSQSWKSWSGLAFEWLCFYHIKQIKKALKLEVIQSEVSPWQSKGEQGAQIDMLIDRSDRVVNLCEIKFSRAEFSIDKAYAQVLRNKIAQFSALEANKKKTIFMTMLTTFGTTNNEYCKELVQSQVVLDNLFTKN